MSIVSPISKLYHPGAMSQKPGRNDPCPCGSGLKYKKCCGLDAGSVADLLIPDDQLSGTPLDEYTQLLTALAFFERKIVLFEADGAELKKARKTYEKRYRPGEDGGLLDSHYMSWLYFDFRFGSSRRTVVERVLDDPMTARLVEPDPTCLREMAASYATFFEVSDVDPAVVRLEELGTGRLWSVYFYKELFDTPAGRGEIWYTRLLGPPERALSYTTPYIYEPETRAQFKRGVDGIAKDFLKNKLSIGVPSERLFAESQKQSALFWAEYIHTANSAPAAALRLSA
jgi:SEC-C motif